MENEKGSWYSSDKGRELEEDHLVDLYIRYHESMGKHLDRHFNIRNYYTVLLSLVLGAYVTGLVQLTIAKTEMGGWLFLSIPMLALPTIISALSLIAIKSATRYYTGFLRMVALVAKIENMLGLDGQVKTQGERHEQLWRKDKEFMDKYYLGSRRKFKSSKKFIDTKKCQGDNKWSTLTFLVFLIVGVGLLVWHVTFVLSATMK